MATSGVTSVAYTATNLIMSALSKVGLIDFDAPSVPSKLRSIALRELNMLLLALQSDGLHLWKEKRLKLTPVTRRNRYVFGTSADAFKNVAAETHTIAAAADTDTTIDVSDAGTYADGDDIEVYLDDGTIHVTTISGTPSTITGGKRITLTDALDGAVQSGAQVLTYEAYTGIPLRVMSAYRRTRTSTGTSFTDIEIDVVTKGAYNEGPVPRTQGEIMSVWLDRERASATLRLYPEPIDDSTQFIMLSVQEPQEIFNTLDDDLDMTPEWYLAVVYSLAKLFMDSNPQIQLEDSHRLNIIRGEEKWVNAAKDFDKVAQHYQIEVDDSNYEVF